jgi:LPXTG-site transpeptidase (sortase) family protein
MKKKALLLILVIIVFAAGIVGGGSYFLLSHKSAAPKAVTMTVSKAVIPTVVGKPDKLFGWKFPVAKFPLTGELSNGNLIAYSSIRDPGGIPQGLPVRLQIPVIGVDSLIEDATITPDGRMDVPAGSVDVAWFALGPHPGQVGSAVIGGHYGIENGVPFVFYQLDKLKVGDNVFIIDDKNDTLAFVVRKIESFDRNADATPVFTSSDGLAHLNLITCEGVWNQVDGNYPQRLVVFTDQIPSEGAITVNTQNATGNTLQATLSITPLPTQKITAQKIVPIAKKQTQTPSIKKQLSIPQMIIASAQSLYSTPLNGIITSLLLLAIVFMTFKIIRRQ